MKDYCVKCRTLVEGDHPEVDCLRRQVELLAAERESWKEAWYAQRQATGKAAWAWQEPWMRVHLERRLQGEREPETCLQGDGS